MSRLGTVIGGTLGGLMGGPAGAFWGAVIGHRLTKNGRSEAAEAPAADEPGLSDLGVALFTCLGKLAKCDGPVNVKEIDAVEGIVADLELSPFQRNVAILAFRIGRDRPTPAAEHLRRYAATIGGRDGMRMFLVEVMHRLAVADGPLARAERAMILEAGRFVGVPESAVIDLVGREGASLEDCYKLLGGYPGMTDAELKRQYHERCLELHPDRLAAKELGAELMAFATKRIGEVRDAYERILSARRGGAG